MDTEIDSYREKKPWATWKKAIKELYQPKPSDLLPLFEDSSKEISKETGCTIS